MTKKTLLCLLAVVTFVSCKKEEDKQPPPIQPPSVLAQATISNTGGKLSTEAFEMIVPEGAFTATSTLKLLKADEESVFGNEVSGNAYRVEGLPEIILKPIKISLRTSDAKTSYLMALGETHFTSSADTIQTGHYLVQPETAGTWCTYELPAMPSYGKTGGTAYNSFSLNIAMVIDYQVVEGTYFKIYTPANLITQAEELLIDLNTALTLYQSAASPMHFTKRQSWPVTVTVKTLKSSVFGYYHNSIWGNNFGYLEFNKDYINNNEMRAVTAGHELLHLAQSLYDPRTSYHKVKYAPPEHWVNEATAVWAEEKFSGTPDYVSPIREGHIADPLDGAQKGAQSNAGYHGYGMAAMMKMLSELFPADDWLPLGDLYDYLEEGSSPMEALSKITPMDFGAFYTLFLNEYVAGEIYADATPQIWFGNSSGTFSVQAAADTLKTFNLSIPQLSAKLYIINMNYPEMDENAYLKCTITGANPSSIAVYKRKGESMQLLASGSAISIQGLKALMNDGWKLLVMAINSDAGDPYISYTDYVLTLRIKTPDLDMPPHSDVDFSYTGYFKWTNSDSVYYQNDGWVSWDMIHNGAFYDDLYIATWDTVNIDNWHFKGSMSIAFDFENQQINWISYKDMIHTGNVKDTISFVVEAVPATSWLEYERVFTLEGANILNHITHLYYKRMAYGNTYNLLEYNCALSCYFSIRLRKWNKKE